MPLPAASISRLSDHFGQYTLCVTCLSCGHTGERLPADLARRYGWDRPLVWILERLRCSNPKCRKRNCKAEVAFDDKPRGWVKNPA